VVLEQVRYWYPKACIVQRQGPLRPYYRVRFGTCYEAHTAQAPYDLIYLVKRALYKLAMAVPPRSSTGLRWEQGIVHVRLTTWGQQADVVLGLAEFKTFYQDMSSLMTYVAMERATACQAPMTVGNADGAISLRRGRDVGPGWTPKRI